MSLENQITELNTNIKTLIGVLSNQNMATVSQVAAPAGSPEPKSESSTADDSVSVTTTETVAIPSIDQLVERAVPYADKHGQEKLLEVIHKYNPDAGKLSEVPEGKRAELFKDLAA